jgi:hypothetical protein
MGETMNKNYFYAPGTGIVKFQLNTKQKDVVADLTGNSLLQLVYTRPDGTTFIRTGAISSTDTNVIEYTVAAGDFDETLPATFGDYTVYALATFGSNPPIAGDPASFEVRKAGVRER